MAELSHFEKQSMNNAIFMYLQAQGLHDSATAFQREVKIDVAQLTSMTGMLSYVLTFSVVFHRRIEVY